MSVRRIRYELSPLSMLYALLFVGGVWLLTRLWPILLVVIGALILAGTVSPLVAMLERRRVKRLWAVAIVYLVLTSTASALMLLIGPPFWRQLLRFVENAPGLQKNLAEFLSAHRLTASLGATVQHFAPEKLLSVDLKNAVSVSTDIVEVVGYTATAFVLSLYLVSDRDRARAALYSVVPRSFHVRLARIVLNLETIVGGYVRGQLITSLAITAFTFGLLTVCKVPGALALAVFAGLTDVIPFVGGLLATAPAALAATSQSIGAGVAVLVGMVLYQELESRVLVPRVYGRTLRLSSATVVVALLIGGKLLGIVGALLALPIAAALRMIIEELRVELPGDDTNDPQLEARDERAERAYARRTAGAAPIEAAAVAVEIAAEIQRTDEARPDGAVTPISAGFKSESKAPGEAS